MQNCETRLSSLFLGHGDHFWQSYDENSLIFIFIYTSYAKRRGWHGFMHPRKTYRGVEVLNLNPAVLVLLIFASIPDCSQNQTAVSDTQHLLSDF